MPFAAICHDCATPTRRCRESAEGLRPRAVALCTTWAYFACTLWGVRPCSAKTGCHVEDYEHALEVRGRRWAALGPALTARSIAQRRRRRASIRATQVCMDVGGRLCTYNEMSAGITIGTGCMYDI